MKLPSRSVGWLLGLLVWWSVFHTANDLADSCLRLGQQSWISLLYILCTKNWDNKAIEQPRCVEDNLPEVLEVDPVVGGQVLAKHREVSVQASNHLSDRQCERLIKSLALNTVIFLVLLSL